MKLISIRFKLVIVSLTFFVVGCSHAATTSHIAQKVSVELRLVQSATNQNCETMEVFGSKRKVCVEQEAYFSNSDIESAKAEIEEDSVMKEPVLILKLTADGSGRFAKFTKENYNKTIAIIFDGKVMSTPIIRETITSGLIYFTGKFSLEEAEAFTVRINRD
jgi:preprotein translocase subunit SecD